MSKYKSFMPSSPSSVTSSESFYVVFVFVFCCCFVMICVPSMTLGSTILCIDMILINNRDDYNNCSDIFSNKNNLKIN